MNIKKLYEALESDRFDWSDYDLGHAKEEAMKILLEPDELIEYWIDGLCDMSGEQEARLLVHVCREMIRAREKPVTSSSWVRSSGTCMVIDALQAGQELIRAIESYLDAHIERNLDSWLASAYEHKCSAEEGMREDYEYERMKDRRMEEVA